MQVLIDYGVDPTVLQGTSASDNHPKTQEFLANLQCKGTDISAAIDTSAKPPVNFPAVVSLTTNKW
jgi:hypothetical protein